MPYRGWWGRIGVEARSAVAATVVLGLLVVTGGVLALVVLHHSLFGGVEDSGGVQTRLVRLVVDADTLRAGAEGEDTPARQVLDRTIGADDDRGVLIQVIRADGTIVAHSLRAPADFPMVQISPPIAVDESVRTVLPGRGDSPWTVTVLGASVEDQYFTVQIAQSATDAEATFRTVVVLLAVGTPLLLLAVALATRVFVGRSLRPVEAIRSTVEGITAAGLHGRVPQPPGRDAVARLAATMNAMLARLETAQRAQQRFVADASHEMRSPVATLKAGAEISLAHPGSHTPEEFSRLVLGESSRLESLVQDLLLLARVDEDRLVVTATDVDLDDLLGMEAARVASLQPRGAGGLTVAVDAVPLRVRGDEGQLSRVLRNLVDNACRHAARRVTLACRAEGPVAVVEVGDDGPGVPVDERERVFERFTRLQESRTRDSGGTGLGLAIVAELVTAHGGTVEADESPAGGALFRVRLPMAEAPQPVSASR
ncbi:sensor histidine kinase [Kineococcus gynurae]|uniref:histidine kinase n=1 Tax=Kineococcus gynurae TaxID=452979 RepID=A0ABV5LPQ5_9ACTN